MLEPFWSSFRRGRLDRPFGGSLEYIRSLLVLSARDSSQFGDYVCISFFQFVAGTVICYSRIPSQVRYKCCNRHGAVCFCRHNLGLVPTRENLELCNKVNASSFCR